MYVLKTKSLFPRILHPSGKQQIVSECKFHTMISAIKKENRVMCLEVTEGGKLL